MTRDMLDADSAAGASTLMVHCDADIRMGMPESGWSRDELSGRARWENEHIGQSRYCAPRYWYLGKILLLVQEAVEQGRWKLWCKEHAIHRNRWRRGRLLALAFASPDEVAGLTVQAAEALAREALGPAATPDGCRCQIAPFADIGQEDPGGSAPGSRRCDQGGRPAAVHFRTKTAAHRPGSRLRGARTKPSRRSLETSSRQTPQVRRI